MRANFLRPLPHSRQAKMPFLVSLAQNVRVYSHAVVTDPYAQLAYLVVEFHFNRMRLRMAEGIAERLLANFE
jgi:hypothetical protein